MVFFWKIILISFFINFMLELKQLIKLSTNPFHNLRPPQSARIHMYTVSQPRAHVPLITHFHWAYIIFYQALFIIQRTVWLYLWNAGGSCPQGWERSLKISLAAFELRSRGHRVTMFGMEICANANYASEARRGGNFYLIRLLKINANYPIFFLYFQPEKWPLVTPPQIIAPKPPFRYAHRHTHTEESEMTFYLPKKQHNWRLGPRLTLVDRDNLHARASVS